VVTEINWLFKVKSGAGTQAGEHAGQGHEHVAVSGWYGLREHIARACPRCGYHGEPGAAMMRFRRGQCDLSAAAGGSPWVSLPQGATQGDWLGLAGAQLNGICLRYSSGHLPSF
jgi:hypothetical protein